MSKRSQHANVNTIKVGDRVRSYDFPTTRSCYVEGVVEFIGRFPEGDNDCDRYKIKVERVVFHDEPCAVSSPYVFPPVNGTLTWLGDVCSGVERIES